jgi:hypothetical protein
MKSKNLISLTLAFAFFILGTSGILLYIKQKAHFIEMTHAIFGLLFISFAIFHFSNNWNSIKTYSKDKNSGSIKKELIVASLIVGIILILSVTEVLEPVAEFGRIFAPKRGPRPSQGVNFQEKTTNDSTNGKTATLILQKSDSAMSASLSVDVTDTSGKSLESLFTQEQKQEPKQEGPPQAPANLILTTKINQMVPFDIVVTANVKGVKQQVKCRVTSLEAGTHSFTLTNESPLKRAVVTF